MKQIIILMTFLFAMLNANAQWTTDTDVNTEVSNYNSENANLDFKSIALDNGRTAIVFWKEVEVTNFELYLQILSSNGEKELAEGGQLISNTIPMSTFTNVWSLTRDKSDNIYVGVTGTGVDAEGNYYSGYAFKLNNQGENQWGSSGIPLGPGYVVTILPLNNGNVAISWMDGSQYTSFIQKFNAEGSPIWENNVLVDPSGMTVPAELFELSNGDIVSIYHQRGSSINSTLWAQKYTSTGAYAWDTPTQLSTTTTAYNYFYSSAQDADVIYFGYIGKANNRFDSYIQRLNADGSIPWGANGLDFDVNQTNFEMDTKIAIEPGSQYLWAICTYTNTSQNASGEYVQKIDITTGTRLFTDNAKNLYTIGSSITHAVTSNLYVYNDRPHFLLQRGYDNGVSTIYLDLSILDENGDFLEEESIPMGSNLGTHKGNGILNKKRNNQTVLVFVEDKGTSNRLYAQNYVLAEECTSPENVEISDITNTQVAISWGSSNSETTLDIEYGVSPYTATGIATIENIDANPYTLTDLSAETAYEIYVRTNCSDGNYSEWTGPFSFTTEEDGSTNINNIINAKDISVYPNPNKGQFKIEINLSVDAVNIQIINSQGQIVKDMKNINTSAPININLEDTKSGLYFVRIRSNNQIVTKKINIIK